MHPNRMLSTYELQNFRRYIAVNPIGPGSRVEGAFDAMPPGLSRRSPEVKDFKRGGRYDFLARDEAESKEAKPRGDLMRLLKTLARMSPENWAQLQRELQENAAEDDNLLEREMKPMDEQYGEKPAMDSRMFDRLSTPRRTAAETSFAKMFPDAMRVKAGSERARW